ncbi:MAG: branched-chain amino acid transport system II carrier protein [Tissierellia bacterium]|nr:branched-chain amino acid transport system II carrier protein [Tissierellia bacterium]
MKKTLTKREFLSVSIMLFGLFFGAGNLIFPPLLGHQAGSLTLQSLLFFSITAVVFPILGVVAVARTKGLSNLANRVDPVFSLIYTSMIYLSIGPGLGIPRAGSLPFEMAIVQYLPEGYNVLGARLLYTALFFFAAFLISLNPSELVNRVGKILTPVLLLLIIFMFVGVVYFNPNQVGTPTEAYMSNAPVKGFLEGYNTMDAIAALNFGLVISLAIKSFRIDDEKKVIGYTIKSGILAGIVLFLVYGMLSYIGMTTEGLSKGAQNGAQILSKTVNYVFGDFGSILLISIFTLACLTTCIGLITSGSQYFADLTKNKINYKTWVVIWSTFSFIVANFGLNTILKVSIPVLISIYPVSLILIVIALAHKYFKFSNLSYRATVYVVTVIAIVEGLAYSKITIPFVSKFIMNLPLFTQSLGWVIPGFVVLFATTIISKAIKIEEVK